MKKLGSLLFVLLLCVSLTGCGESKKSTADITKAFDEIGYKQKIIDEKGIDAVSLVKNESNGDTSQIIAYFEDKNLYTIGYLLTPADSSDYEKLVVGFVYLSSDAKKEYEINKDASKIVDKILGKVDLTVDELVEYAKDVYKDKK